MYRYLKGTELRLEVSMATILIIDDQDDDRALLSSLVQEHGHTVLEAWSALEGLQVVEQQHIDLIFMDLAMPGLNGWQATDRLKGHPRFHAIPVIAVTVYIPTAALNRLMPGRFDGYLPKPIDEGD